MGDFVLVHGAGHGAWCWDRVAPILRERGHRVFIPVLKGVGERFDELSPEIDLSTHIDDVASLIERENLSDLVLVGHSYGCMVITGVADRLADRIGTLVFIDGPHPADGECILDTLPALRTMLEKGSRQVGGVDLCLFPDRQTIEAMFGIREPEDIVWAEARLTPHPWKCFVETLRLDNDARVRAIPRTSIDCLRSGTQDDPALVERSRAAGRHFLLDTGHDPMITAPQELASLLAAQAAAS